MSYMYIKEVDFPWGRLHIFQIFLGVLTLISGLNIYLASAHQITSVLLVFGALNLYYFRAK